MALAAKLIEWCTTRRHICSAAAFRNEFDILKLAYLDGCPLSSDGPHICIQACRNGNLEMLKWARAQGCPWDEISVCDQHIYHPGDKFCAFALRYNQKEILIWAIRNGCPYKRNIVKIRNYLMSKIDKYRDFDATKWIIETFSNPIIIWIFNISKIFDQFDLLPKELNELIKSYI
jgi:hypothetical protein